MKQEYRHTRAGAVRLDRRVRLMGDVEFWFLLSVIIAVALYGTVRTIQLEDARAESLRSSASAAKARRDLATTSRDLEMRGSEITGLKQNALSLEASITALNSALESATTTIDALEEDLSDALRRQRTAPTKQPISYAPNVWSRAMVAGTIKSKALAAGVPEADASWLADKGADIAYRESTYNTHAVNGDQLGLFQFNAGWGDTAGRLDGTASCAKFVSVYVRGGRTAIEDHWAATY